jgi:RNA polymerase sigma-70 factor (ECF subfamily)
MVAMSTTGSATTAQEGALERLGRLFDVQHQRLHRLALRLAPDAEAARDLVQETFLRAARRPGALPADEAGGEAWLVRVLVNLCRDRYRRRSVRQREQHHLAEPQVAGVTAAANPEAAAVARATVTAALAQLPARRRAVVVLAELEELSTTAISRLLGISAVTVRWHLAAGRKELARRLGVASPTAAEPALDEEQRS